MVPIFLVFMNHLFVDFVGEAILEERHYFELSDLKQVTLSDLIYKHSRYCICNPK